MTTPMNTYVPNFVPNDLPWYERDGLMTWYDKCKCDDFLRDTGKHLKEANIVNFDIIHRECREEMVPKDLLKYYQTFNNGNVSKYPTPEQDKILASAFRTKREDIFFEQKTIKKHFGKNKSGKKLRLFYYVQIHFNFFGGV